MRDLGEIFDVFFNGRPSVKRQELDRLKQENHRLTILTNSDKLMIAQLIQQRDGWRSRALACENRHR